MSRKNKLRARDVIQTGGRFARFMFKSHLLTAFLVLCALGVFVGAQSRPDPRAIPYAELFNQMSVLSYRESPSDTTARFMVQLSAGGRVFHQYDVDARSFLPPARARDYNRNITGTFYYPLEVRGHVAEGLWLDMPRQPGPSLVLEQFDELYRATLDFVKPVSLISGVLGTLSGYSVGYRLATWNSSLSSRAVQERVLASPDLGRLIAREAWRRVLLEPAVMGNEDDAARFAAVRGTQRIYAAFFRVALNDSDGFIPREAERLAQLGHMDESRAMLDFAEAVQRAARDSLHLAGRDFAAVERWASLLVRRGHWAYDAIPPAGEERAQYLGMLAWYGVAPPASDVDRVWVGPRMLVRDGEIEGFVADEIPASGVGCPIAWRAKLQEQPPGASAMASVWLGERPEFVALAALGRRVAGGLASVARQITVRPPVEAGVRGARPRGLDLNATTTAAFASRITTLSEPAPSDSASGTAAAQRTNFGIRDPRDSSQCFAQLRVAHGAAIATAGDWEHFSLAEGTLIERSTVASAERPQGGLVSVTVLAPNISTADSACVALLDHEPADARRLAQERTDLSAILIERGSDGADTLWVEADLREWFVMPSGCAERLRVEYY